MSYDTNEIFTSYIKVNPKLYTYIYKSDFLERRYIIFLFSIYYILNGSSRFSLAEISLYFEAKISYL